MILDFGMGKNYTISVRVQTNLKRVQYARTIYSLLNWAGDIGGFYSIVWSIGFYINQWFAHSILMRCLIKKIYKVKFKLEKQDII